MDKHDPSSTRTPISGPPNQNKWLPIFVLRLIGYALLLLTLVDTLAMLLPPKLFDPAWELDTIGRLVGQAPVQLIGFALVTYGGLRFRQSLDQYCFRAVLSRRAVSRGMLLPNDSPRDSGQSAVGPGLSAGEGHASSANDRTAKGRARIQERVGIRRHGTGSKIPTPNHPRPKTRSH